MGSERNGSELCECRIVSVGRCRGEWECFGVAPVCC
jgi:hypothetical protein